jgi:serine carboxypeptidase-like clade 2
MRVMVFSGSIDGIVPTLGTRKWIYEKVQPTVRVEWHPYTVDGQVGGYVQHYNGGFSFATVRGAGHMCPATQPARSFFLFKSFMSGVDL